MRILGLVVCTLSRVDITLLYQDVSYSVPFRKYESNDCFSDCLPLALLQSYSASVQFPDTSALVPHSLEVSSSKLRPTHLSPVYVLFKVSRTHFIFSCSGPSPASVIPFQISLPKSPDCPEEEEETTLIYRVVRNDVVIFIYLSER